jgi:hypothetical protein
LTEKEQGGRIPKCACGWLKIVERGGREFGADMEVCRKEEKNKIKEEIL